MKAELKCPVCGEWMADRSTKTEIVMVCENPDCETNNPPSWLDESWGDHSPDYDW